MLAGAVALVVLVVIAFVLQIGGSDDKDTTSEATFTNSLGTLGTFAAPYSAYMTSGFGAGDVVPEEFATRVSPLKKDFDLGVEEWMSRYDAWSLPKEKGTGMPTQVAVIAFNNALVDWAGTHEAYHRVLEECAGERARRECSEPDNSDAGQAWNEGLSHLRAAEKEMHASAGDATVETIFQG